MRLAAGSLPGVPVLLTLTSGSCWEVVGSNEEGAAGGGAGGHDLSFELSVSQVMRKLKD